MATPKDFNGIIKIDKNPSFRFLETTQDQKDEPFTIFFYRRETDKYSIGEFIDSIGRQNIAWDGPTKQLFYKDEKGITYKLNFQRLK
jgi:hypothetical protein